MTRDVLRSHQTDLFTSSQSVCVNLRYLLSSRSLSFKHRLNPTHSVIKLRNYSYIKTMVVIVTLIAGLMELLTACPISTRVLQSDTRAIHWSFEWFAKESFLWVSSFLWFDLKRRKWCNPHNLHNVNIYFKEQRLTRYFVQYTKTTTAKCHALTNRRLWWICSLKRLTEMNRSFQRCAFNFLPILFH